MTIEYGRATLNSRYVDLFKQAGRWKIKRLVLSLLAVSILLLVACSAPKNTQTITVTTRITQGPAQTAMVTVTKTFTYTVTTTLTITGTSPDATTTPPTTTPTTPTTTPPTTTPLTTTTQTFNITGIWSGEWWRSDGGEEGTLIVTLVQSDGSLSGDMTFTSTTFEYSEDTVILGSVAGSDVVFGMAISSNGETVTIDYEGTISEDGNRMSGTYYISTGWTGTWEITRQ